MDLSDRLFAPPASDAAKVEGRQARLPPRLRALILRAGDALAAGRLDLAQRTLAQALMMDQRQADVLRMYGLLLAQVGNLEAALANLEAALRAAPDDAMSYWQYAQVREQAGDVAGALRLRQRAVACLPASPLAWSDLGEHLFTYRGAEQSLAPLERAVELAPDYAPALFKLGSAYVACGRTADGAGMTRRALVQEPAFGAAWMGLVDIKTIAITDDEMHRMRELLAGASSIDEGERTAIEFALAGACEQKGRYPEAWRLLVDANARRKRELPAWPEQEFRERESRAEEVFARHGACASNAALGREVVFVVGMPRSGTTLVEQILAAHPRVQAAGELSALPQVLTEESARRQQRYPDWVPESSASDWERLGRRYLELTADFRREWPVSTDKLPTNWRALGAIRAMLPGAHVVICRRDPLENCWSCFKQYFTQGWAFTYDIGQLALVWKTFDQAAMRWATRAPASIRQQGYEALTEEPEGEIRALLDFCGLPFDAACLAFHEARRSVHTLSAAQVRKPLYRHASTAAAYGALLDPLRKALGLPLQQNPAGA